MSVYIHRLDFDDCKIYVTISHDGDSEIDGTIEIEIEGYNEPIKKAVKISPQEKKIEIDETPKTGDIRKVNVSLKSSFGNASYPTTPLALCKIKENIEESKTGNDSR